MAIVQLDKILSGVNGNLEHVVVYNENTYATKLKDYTNGVFVALGGLEDGEREAKKASLAKGGESDILLVHAPELMYDEKKKLRDFRIEEGAVVRAYRLTSGDIITFTEDLLPASVAVGKEIAIKNGKLVASSEQVGAKLVFTVIEDSGNELDITKKAFALQLK